MKTLFLTICQKNVKQCFNNTSYENFTIDALKNNARKPYFWVYWAKKW